MSLELVGGGTFTCQSQKAKPSFPSFFLRTANSSAETAEGGGSSLGRGLLAAELDGDEGNSRVTWAEGGSSGSLAVASTGKHPVAPCKRGLFQSASVSYFRTSDLLTGILTFGGTRFSACQSMSSSSLPPVASCVSETSQSEVENRRQF